jgi:hypothetical protein
MQPLAVAALLEAFGVNDEGQIFGYAYQSTGGDYHDFLATPTTQHWALSVKPTVVLPENVRN